MVVKVCLVGLTVVGLVACGNDTTSKSQFDAIADDTSGPDAIECAPCTTPPATSCDGAALVTWTSPGTCGEDGTCIYAESRTTCELGCEAGACVGDPCEGVTCNTPPSTCFAATGTCTSGDCSYAPLTGASCDDGNACTSNDSCDAGTCIGAALSCDTPPPARCTDTSRLEVFATTGVCGEGACSYTSTSVECPGGCADDACVGDPCEGVLCETPPSGCYESVGTCENGVCSYSPDDGRGCDDGDSCTTTDVCQAGVCRGAALACTTPDFGPTCADANTRRTPVTPGTCGEGTCTYGTRDTSCAFGCVAGSCVGDPCNNVSCDAPPAPSCQGSTLRTSVAGSGACSGGTCSWTFAETTCTNGCQSGACVAPTGLIISELLFDSTGSPDKDAFLEIHGAPGTSLDGVKVVAINGNGGTEYATIALSGQLGQDGLYVIAHPNAQPLIADVADLLSASVDLQNSPDSVQLRFGAQVLDALAYGSFGTGEVAAGEGAPAERAPVNESLARDHLFTDTDDNFTDFKAGPPTPATPTPVASDCSEPCTGGKLCVGPETCSCPAGYHDSGEVCVEDEVCAPNSCFGNGDCTILDGRVTCDCDMGYSGAQCAQCAAGYHDDGTGACTDDPCLPSPCDVAHKTVCEASTTTTSGYVCLCDAGYHPDGVGGCTTDPCTPNPCAASNQACQAQGNSYTCYTPQCDDGNPCTDNALVNGVCQTTTRANGSACSTTVCTTGQTCQTGACQGGSQLICNDDNPCTVDACNAVTGCTATANDNLVPDDGAACTDSFCQNGQAQHIPDDDACGGSFCTGAGHCDPTHAGARADGCYFTDAPTPPAEPTGPCRYYGACNEATNAFPLIELAAGASCNDGLACTTNSVCTASGACVGSVIEGCFGAACGTTVPMPATINVTRAAVSGTITLNGGDWPARSRDSNTITYWMRDQETGYRHRLYQMTYNYVSGSPEYALSNNTPSTFNSGLPTGVYDLIYSRGTSDDTVYATNGLEAVPMGYRTLQKNVVIGPGTNVLNINVTRTAVSGTITLNGGDWPARSRDSNTITYWMRDRDTGYRHRLYQMTYNYVSGSPEYALSSNTPASFTAGLPAGAYDLIYARGISDDTVYATHGLELVPMGYRTLQQNIVVGTGAKTLNIDVPRASVSGTITLNGGAWPARSNDSNTITYWMRDRDTGYRHRLYQMTYNYVSGSPEYALSSNTPASFDAGLPTGAYDLIYSRGASDDTVYATSGVEAVPMGYRLLKQNVVIGAGANTLNIDVTRAAVSGVITLNSGDWPARSRDSNTITYWMRDQATGYRHRLYQMTYNYVSGSPEYALSSNTPASFNSGLPTGTYDLIYSRGASGDTVYATSGLEAVPMGYRLLQQNIVVAPGPNTLNINVTRASVSGAITLNGGEWPARSRDSNTITYWMRDQATGYRHRLYQMTYNYVSGSPEYALSNNTPPSFDSGLPTGTYDLIYSRGTSDDTVYATHGLEAVPMGYRTLQRNLVIGAGSNTLSIDVTRKAVPGAITLNGGAWPARSRDSNTITYWMRDRDTGYRHRLYQMTYNYVSGSPEYALSNNTPASFDGALPTGVYDLIYARGTSNDTTYATNGLEPVPMGYRVLNRCVQIP